MWSRRFRLPTKSMNPDFGQALGCDSGVNRSGMPLPAMRCVPRLAGGPPIYVRIRSERSSSGPLRARLRAARVLHAVFGAALRQHSPSNRTAGGDTAGSRPAAHNRGSQESIRPPSAPGGTPFVRASPQHLRPAAPDASAEALLQKQCGIPYQAMNKCFP
jgi:hypothetical protein